MYINLCNRKKFDDSIFFYKKLKAITVDIFFAFVDTDLKIPT